MNALWLTEADVVALLDPRAAISAIETGLVAEASGTAQDMVKTHVQWGAGGTLHAIGAAFSVNGLVGTKTWAHTEGGAAPLLVSSTPTPRAARGDRGVRARPAHPGVEWRRAGSPTRRQTSWRSSAPRRRWAVAAVAAARLRAVRVFSPPRAPRAFAARVGEAFGAAARACASVEEAVAGARSSHWSRGHGPFPTRAMLARGAHVNGGRGVTPERASSMPMPLRAVIVAADGVLAVQHLSRIQARPQRRLKAVTLPSAIVMARRRTAQTDDAVQSNGDRYLGSFRRHRDSARAERR
jgi:ornithine cyclodeaminase